MTGTDVNSRLIPVDAAHPNVLHALIRKRAQIAGRIEQLQLDLRDAVADLDSMDAAIHVFDPSIALQEIRSKPVPPRHQAFKGEMSRIVFSTIRIARVKLKTAEIADKVIEGRGLSGADLRLRRLIANRVGVTLRNWEKKGLLRSEQGSDRVKYWEMMPCDEKNVPRRLPRS